MSTQRKRWPELGEGALLFLLAVIAYSPALSCGFIWDDDQYVEFNKALETRAGLVRIWTEPTASPQYYPLVFTTFWIERRIYALDPAGYHLVNVLLHAASGVLLWRILRRLSVPAAWFAAALWTLHPVLVESVAWVTERKNVLSGLLYLSAAMAYLRFAFPDAPSQRRLGFYVLAVALFVLALLSKTVTCSLPAALLLILWWKRPRLGWRDVVPLVPMFAVGAGLAYVTVWMEKHHVGARGIDFELSALDRILIASRALCFYLGKLVWPVDLTFIYPRWTIEPDSPSAYAYLVLELIALAGLWFGRRLFGKGPLVAMIFFAGTLVPALGFIDVYPMRFSFVADHFQYLASIGPLVLMAVGGKVALEALFRHRPGLPALIGAAWLVTLGMITWSQVHVYLNREILWTDTLDKNPDCWMAHQNLGELAHDKSDLKRARDHFQEAMRLAPREAGPHYGMGKTYYAEQDPVREKMHYEKALELKPDFPQVHYNLGLLLRKQDRLTEAVEHYEAAIRSRPEYADAHKNLGIALGLLDRTAEAIPHFEVAVKLQPEDPGPLLALVFAYRVVGKRDESRTAARKGIERFPNDTRFRELLD